MLRPPTAIESVMLKRILCALALCGAAILIAVPAALLLANVVAALPGRAAARTHPARLLRSE